VKVFIVLGLACATSFTSYYSYTGTRVGSETAAQTTSNLQLSVDSSKRVYKRGDQFRLRVMLTNAGQQDVFVFGTLDWGYSASLMFHIRDAAGNEVQPSLAPDAQTDAAANDKSAFVRLAPEHFLGTTYFAPLKFMNLNKPGKYAIFVEYDSPFSVSEVSLSPFWGKENGTIKSNVVWIQVAK